MTIPLKAASLIGASLLLVGASLGTAQALPAAQVGSGLRTATGIERAAYLHRKYSHRSMRRNAPNRFCQNQPSRCR